MTCFAPSIVALNGRPQPMAWNIGTIPQTLSVAESAIASVIACAIVVLVAATDFPSDPWVVYAAIGLFLFVRLLDDFVFMPLTIGRSLRMHPLLTVLMIFVGGAVAGVAGLMLVRERITCASGRPMP